MKGKKPELKNVIPMKGEMAKRVPDAPDDMCGKAAEVWRELAPLLVAKDRLDPSYVYQFRSYCQNVANFIDATACLEMDGLYYSVKTRNGLQQKATAALKIQMAAMDQMRRDSALFGLSPVDDARLKGGGSQGDLFAEVMSQLKNGTD